MFVTATGDSGESLGPISSNDRPCRVTVIKHGGFMHCGVGARELALRRIFAAWTGRSLRLSGPAGLRVDALASRLPVPAYSDRLHLYGIFLNSQGRVQGAHCATIFGLAERRRLLVPGDPLDGRRHPRHGFSALSLRLRDVARTAFLLTPASLFEVGHAGTARSLLAASRLPHSPSGHSGRFGARA